VCSGARTTRTPRAPGSRVRDGERLEGLDVRSRSIVSTPRRTMARITSNDADG
jgi:hypothetical protein